MSAKAEFKIKFRGVRGSHPVSSKDKIRYGGNTSCVEIMANGHVIIIDGGTGIIEVGNDLVKSRIASSTNHKKRKPIEALILFSHSHLDHIQGFPFFKPAYIRSSKLYMYGSRSRNTDFKQVLSDSIFDPVFPIELKEMSANININNLEDGDTIILYPDQSEPVVKTFIDDEELQELKDENLVIIQSYKSFAHPKDGVIIFKITCNGKTVVYASDKECYIGGDHKFSIFSRGADLLIHDAQYTMEDYISPVNPKQGYGHSTPEMAVESAKVANVNQLVLYHLDPSYNDDLLDKIEEKTKGAFSNSCIASEGLEIDILSTKCVK